MDLKLHQLVELKKTHLREPELGGAARRYGREAALSGCGHEVMAPRRKIEKSIKRILSKEEPI